MIKYVGWRRVLLLSTVLAALALPAAWLSRDLWWPMVSHIKQSLLMSQPEQRQNLDYIVNTLGRSASSSTYRQIVKVRQWVNTHSIHQIDAEHDSYAFRLPKVIGKLRQFNEAGGTPPHLSCGPRAYAMKAILDALGIESRIIDLFVVVQGEVLSHTLLEAFDRDRGEWILQDPDFNVSYVHALTGKPLSVRDALLADKRDIAAESDGSRIENPDNLAGTVRNYFQLGVLLRHSYTGGRSIFLYTPAFDVDGVRVRHNNGIASFRKYLQERDFSPDFQPLEP